MPTISQLPPKERPREKLLSCGVNYLSDAELLAIFINTGIKGKTAIELAYHLLNRFGGIRNIFDADATEICNIPGIGKVKYAKLQAALEISRRYLEEQLINTNVIDNSEAAYLYLNSKLRNHKREIFACLLLNSQNRVIHYEELFFGTINNTTVYPREIAKIALQYNAASIIFAHNHPSGAPTPSSQDKHLTNSLTKILRQLDIKVLDHIVIGNNGFISLVSVH